MSDFFVVYSRKRDFNSVYCPGMVCIPQSLGDRRPLPTFQPEFQSLPLFVLRFKTPGRYC